MNEEAGFLSAIRQAPADDTARLVYADWLDEQPDPACRTKANFIRLEQRLGDTPEQSLNRIRWLNHLQKLTAALDSVWLATVSRPQVEACRTSPPSECRGRWDRLATTSSSKARFCESCRGYIHYCTSLQEARARIEHGNSVVLSLSLVRRPNDLVAPASNAEPGRLTPEMLEQLRVAANLVTRIGVSRSEPEPIAPAPVPVWVPQPTERVNSRPHRRQSGRHRRIERENWEEME